jgi:uncharacterized protein (DUF4415 family)
MEKKKLGLYRREKQPDLKDEHMRTDTETQDELLALARMRDEDIDTSDIPEVKDWSRALVGKFYRPIKEPVTLRIDTDVLVWLKTEGPGYQTRINTLLRAAMTGDLSLGTSKSDETHSASCEFDYRNLHFPSLEKHGELEKCNQVAERIETQHCVFALAGR